MAEVNSLRDLVKIIEQANLSSLEKVKLDFKNQYISRKFG